MRCHGNALYKVHPLTVVLHLRLLLFFEPAFFEPAFFESFSTILDFVDFKSLYFSCAEDDKLQMLCH